MSNVIGHVGSEVTITVSDAPLVRVEIHNHEAATEAFRDLLHRSPTVPHDSPTGRGLRLVRSLASRVGLDDDDGGGKVVWFEWDHPAVVGDGDASLEADGDPVATSWRDGPNRWFSATRAVGRID